MLRETDSNVPQAALFALFLKDVARLPIINGRSEYIPLTRRIQRYMSLVRLRCATLLEQQQSIMAKVNAALKRLKSETTRRHIPMLDIDKLVVQIEPFLDDPEQLLPPALAAYVDGAGDRSNEANEYLVNLAWQTFYWLALIPPGMRALVQEPMETSDFEAHLALVVDEGKEAKRRLVEGTLRYVINIARLYLDTGLPMMDLVQEGTLGLMRATETFVEHHGAHFQHHAGAWIRQRIDRYIADHRTLIRLPVHILDSLKQLRKVYEGYQDRYGCLPDPFVIRDNSVWPFPTKHHYTDENMRRLKLRTVAQKWHEAYLIAYSPTVSIEAPHIFESAYQRHEIRLGLDTLLIDPNNLIVQGELSSLRKLLAQLMGKHLSERQVQIVSMRYGLEDGEERTLEAIGQKLGLTRERIRQIIVQALKTLAQRLKRLRISWDSDTPTYSDSVAAILRAHLTHALQADTERATGEPEMASIEPSTVDRLIRRYLKRGRKRNLNTAPSIRSAVLSRALETLGKPAHFRAIWEQANRLSKGTLDFGPQEAYRTLFYGNCFRRFGDGVFGLSAWEAATIGTNGERQLTTCPMPLLPGNSYATAFFESLIVARELLGTRSLTVSQFWQEMTAWARRFDLPIDVMQSAFDAWYVAGLCAAVDVISDQDSVVVLTLPKAIDVPEARTYCLQKLCERVQRMPELLAALDRIGRPTLASLQSALFGSETDGFDVATRLLMLVALDAARKEGNEWSLTDLGRTVLAKFPPTDIFYDADLEGAVPAETKRGSTDWDLLEY